MMDTFQNLVRIKDNLYLIPEARFDVLIKDKDYSSSLIYLVSCTIISVPIELAVSLLFGNFSSVLRSLPIAVPLSIIIAYLFFLFQHILLRFLGGKAEFLDTVQIFIYGTTPSIIFGGVPLLGLVALIISVVNSIVGASKIHKISYYRSASAIVIIPALIIIIILSVIYGFLVKA